VASSLVLGAAVAGEPRLAPALVLLIGLAVWFAVRRELVWWDLVALVVGGVYVLDYGFSNIAAPGPGSLPLVDLIAAALVLRAATQPGFRWPASPPFVLAAVFVGLTAVRLAVDYASYGALAIRDATLGLELAFLFIGYWAIKRYGLRQVVRLLSVVFVLGLLYMVLYPFRDAIADASPKVGIQQPVPLFGAFVGNLAFVGAFFFLTLVRPFGARSYLLAAAALPLMVLVQIRGLYLAVPAAIAVVWFLGRAQTGVRARRRLAATLGVGALALVLFFPLAPEGRLGEVSPSFVVAQLATLSGNEGPSAGSLDDRKEWFENVMHEVRETPAGWLVGVGLGPDLAAGAENQGNLIRKPHNDYLEIFARYGLVGFVVFMGFFATAFGRIVRGARAGSGLSGQFLWFAVAQTVVLGIIAATQPLLAFPYGTVPLFFVMGAALAVAERPRDDWAP
jgi:O-antigen ligase